MEKEILKQIKDIFKYITILKKRVERLEKIQGSTRLDGSE